MREHIESCGELLVRANSWSDGEGLRRGRELGADLSSGMEEFYGRAMPAPPAAVPEERFVDLAQLYGRCALVLDDSGHEFAPDPISWSETDLVQAIARRPNASAWYLVDEDALDVEIRGRTVRDMVDAAREAGGEVLLPKELGIELPDAYTHAVHVVAGITHTIGGLRIDPHARVLQIDGAPIEGLYAAGADAGGISHGRGTRAALRRRSSLASAAERLWPLPNRSRPGAARPRRRSHRGEATGARRRLVDRAKRAVSLPRARVRHFARGPGGRRRGGCRQGAARVRP